MSTRVGYTGVPNATYRNHGTYEFINPQLATAVEKPPPRAGWLHEVEHDGYRTLLIVERRRVRAYTRNGFDWTERYSGIAKAAGELTAARR